MTHTFEYIFLEHYILVLSHDEVVYGKGSMWRKMPGDAMSKFGSLKCYYTMMMGHPGKKLLFMGQDFAQENEWNYNASLDWHLCNEPGHRDVMDCWRALLKLYRERPVLHDDTGTSSFEWIESGDINRSIFSFIRRNPWNYNDALIFVVNMTPVDYYDFGVGAPVDGKYKRVFSTYPDGSEFIIDAKEELCNGRPYKLSFDLRPFEAIVFEVPYHASTEEEKKEEQRVKSRAKREHKLVKTTVHAPAVDIPAELLPEEQAAKENAKKSTSRKSKTKKQDEVKQ